MVGVIFPQFSLGLGGFYELYEALIWGAQML
jgi:hypothetical protein